MTGTAKTEEKEFVEIYDLHVVEIPTNVDVARQDKNDFIFRTKEGKFQAVIRDIKERNEQGQPVLLGTIAVETSEYLAQLLERQGIKHNVLNAKQHEREAEIIKDAGQLGAVTIATNMAGRGVDIKLGEGVREAGGLYVLGTERHEARRIDNQLRGRAGRQGDPGESRFYLSGEDELVRLFAGDRIKNIMQRFKVPDDEPMEASILSKQIENAQKKVEEQNFVMRKNVLKYDDVMNSQRQVIYAQRRRVLEGQDMSEEILGWIDDVVEGAVDTYTEAEYAEEWDLGALTQAMHDLYGSDITPEELKEEVALERDALVEEFQQDARDAYGDKEQELGVGVDARPRALRHAPGGRHPVARAPREHGLPARGSAPPRVRAEGPARRVPRRGPQDVRGARTADPRGGRRHALPRAARAAGRRGARAARPAERRQPLLRARDRCRSGRDRRRGGRRRFGRHGRRPWRPPRR